jgi:hypothetical protein
MPDPVQALVRIGAGIVGLLLGYVAYLPALAIVMFMAYGRVDEEKYFYGLYLPFQSPLLLSEDFRGNLLGEEFFLLVLGSALLVLGAILGVATVNRRLKRVKIENA